MIIVQRLDFSSSVGGLHDMLPCKHELGDFNTCDKHILHDVVKSQLGMPSLNHLSLRQHDNAKPTYAPPNAPTYPMRNGTPDPNRDSIVRETNREIRASLRDDWVWPSSAPLPNRVDPTTPWCERGSSPSSSSELESPDPYKYDTPDSVAEWREGRKRQRRGRFLEEVNWNEGLRTFVDRRNAWTGARFTSSASVSGVEMAAESGDARLPSSAGLESGSQTHDNFTNTTLADFLSSPSPASELLPLPAPIIPPSNPIRASITPAAYTHIYNKVIVEGTTPKIPINLADMTKAITEGWKANGEWPPMVKVAEVVPIARRRKKTVGHGGDKQMDQAVGSGQGRSRRKSLTMRGVGRVKKALGLKGDGDGNADSVMTG